MGLLHGKKSSSPANKSLRGSRGPKAGVRGIPSPFINLDERGRDAPHPSLPPLLPRKDFLDERQSRHWRQPRADLAFSVLEVHLREGCDRVRGQLGQQFRLYGAALERSSI